LRSAFGTKPSKQKINSISTVVTRRWVRGPSQGKHNAKSEDIFRKHPIWDKNVHFFTNIRNLSCIKTF